MLLVDWTDIGFQVRSMRRLGECTDAWRPEIDVAWINFSRLPRAASGEHIDGLPLCCDSLRLHTASMKRIRLDRWASQIQPPRNPRLHLLQQRCPFSSGESSRPSRRQLQQRPSQTQHSSQCRRLVPDGRRRFASAAAAQAEEEADIGIDEDLPQRNAPSHRQAHRSGKLAALHARLALPSKLPLQTLARCLIDASVDSRAGYNNQPLALLGQDLLGYYTAEWLLCHYPRLPMPVLFAAQYAYVGSETLAAMRSEWGVEVVAAPGREVDPGLLQLKRTTAGNAMAEDGMTQNKDLPKARSSGSGRRNEEFHYRRGISSRIVQDDQFGDLQTDLPTADERPYPGAPISDPAEGAEATEDAPLHDPAPTPELQAQQDYPEDTRPTTVAAASASFIRALTGALYLHAGTAAVQHFHKNHVLSRHLPLHTLFAFTHPTRDLSRLCQREGLEPPVARLISETGRLSRTPVYVVGVFSGEDKLGEGAGSSLNEGRVRAAAAALRSWYLYSPPESEVVLPSSLEGGAAKDREARRKKWKPQHIDIGEIIT